MLPKKYRLAKDKDFKKILTKGKSFFSPDFKLKYLANKLDFSRCAIIISTKISKKATRRNRLKRQVREIIRLNLKKIKPGYNLLIYLNKPALNKSYHQLEEKLLADLTKSRLLK